MVAAVSRSWWLTFAVALVAACSSADLKPSTVAPTTGSSSGNPDGEVDPDAPPIEGGRDPEPDGGTLAMSKGVTIQVQPTDQGKALLATVRAAKKSVHMTMYLLSSNEMIDALGDLKQAGKDVKVILNKTFPPNGGDNTDAFNTLKARGVAVQWAPTSYTFTHAKTIIIDGASAVIMTMNLTFTSPTTNREYIATDTDPQDVADLETIFDADYTNKQVNVLSKLVISPEGANSLFTPRTHLKALIDSAKTSLDVEAQSLSDTSIVDAIVLAHQAKVAVRVVIDGDTVNTPNQQAAVTKLKQYGVPLRSLKSPDMHAKAIVVDETRTFIGSQNMTPTALVQNREVGVITDAASEATKVRQVIADDFAKGSQL